MIFVTGDTHGSFDRVCSFCKRMNTTKDDVLIILGDAGLNFYGGIRDYCKKELLQSTPITIFAIHGNHERRPQTIETYKEKKWNGGIVFYEEEYPNILFAKDGEVFDLEGLKTIAIGGAYSIDKEYRIRGISWWEDEQPSEETKAYVEKKLDSLNWKVDVVLSHTVPLKYEPVEVFMPGIDQSLVDKSTEEWLDSLESRLSYRTWYAGHYHTAKKVDKLELMFENFDEFCSRTV